MTTVELGRVRPLCRCGAPYLTHEFTQGAVAWDNDACTGYEPPKDWPRVRTPGSAAPRLFGFAPLTAECGHCNQPFPLPVDVLRHQRATDCGISPRPVVAQLLADVAVIVGAAQPQGWPRHDAQFGHAESYRQWNDDGPVISPRPVVAQLLEDVAAIIARRRQECYGSVAITDAQVDELSRAIVAVLTATYRIEENT